MKKIKLFFKSLGLILLYLIWQEITGLFANFYKGNLIMQNTILIISAILITAILIMIFKEELLKDFINIKEKYNDYIPKCVKYWAIGFAATYVINIIISVFLLNGIAPNEEANRLMIKTYPIYTALSVCLLSPICEEILFRLSFRSCFKRKIPFVLFTGIFFASAHLLASTSLSDLFYIFSYSALGITFSLACYNTDNIFSSMFTHVLHNTITYLLIITFI